MYHCHFEDVEHVQMGMTGMVFVRPKQNKTAGRRRTRSGTKYAYNDGDGSTRYDREFAFMITELWSAAHYRDAHIQVSDWTDYDPELLAAQRPRLPRHPRAERRPDCRPRPAGCSTSRSRSLITCNAGERVLLRMSNLGYQNHAMTVDNIDLHDRRQGRQPAARPRRHAQLPRRPTPSTSAPARAATCSSPRPRPGEYLLYDRNYAYLDNGGGPGYGGMMTEIRRRRRRAPTAPRPAANA